MSKSISKYKDHVKNILVSDVKLCLDFLTETIFFDNKTFNFLISLKSQLTKIEDDIISGGLTFENYSLSKNKLIQGVLFFIDSLSSESIDYTNRLLKDLDLGDTTILLNENYAHSYEEFHEIFIKNYNIRLSLIHKAQEGIVEATKSSMGVMSDIYNLKMVPARSKILSQNDIVQLIHKFDNCAEKFFNVSKHFAECSNSLYVSIKNFTDLLSYSFKYFNYPLDSRSKDQLMYLHNTMLTTVKDIEDRMKSMGNMRDGDEIMLDTLQSLDEFSNDYSEELYEIIRPNVESVIFSNKTFAFEMIKHVRMMKLLGLDMEELKNWLNSH